MMEWFKLDGLRLMGEGMMMHPGLSDFWVGLVLLGMLLSVTVIILKPIQEHSGDRSLGKFLRGIVTRPWVLLMFRLLFVTIFLLVIIAGLFGTPIPERNLATTLTWTIWWTGLIAAVFFLGSAWCAVCPWDAIATWLVRLHLWKKGVVQNSLQLKVPKGLRNIWMASWMFIILTWLELGYGMTTSPYATALLCLVIVVLALASQVIYERKAFCRYFCSVGRTIGYYATLSPVALRPIDPDICASCKTLECFHGNGDIEPCPTHLVLGKSQQNSFCTSCGACTQSCPYQNINWAMRPVGSEAITHLRPRWDEAWFVLILVSLTSFHGITMLPGWESWVSQLAVQLGDSGQLLWSFSSGMLLAMLIPIGLFALLVAILHKSVRQETEYKRLFALLALPLIPLAFAYHLAHNLNHLLREGNGIGAVLLNPLGRDALPLSQHELHMRHMSPILDQQLIFAMQAGLMVFGFWLATRIVHRRTAMFNVAGDRIKANLGMGILITCITCFNVWLMMQPMVMRM